MGTKQRAVAIDKKQIGKRSERSRGLTLGPNARPTLVTLPILETDWAELEDGSLVEMIEDPEQSSRTVLAIFKAGEVRFAHKHKCAGQVLVPIPRGREIVRHVRLPRGAKPYESVAFLLQKIDAVFSCCLDLEEKYRFLLASFVLSTWFIEHLPVAPYVALVGLPCSGKSTVLRLLSLLCRRSLLTADITSAALYRVVNIVGARPNLVKIAPLMQEMCKHAARFINFESLL